MIILIILLIFLAMLFNYTFTFIFRLIYKLRTNNLLENICSKEDLLDLKRIHLVDVVAEVFKRKGYKVEFTDKCGEEGNGLLLNDLIYVEVWKHSLKHIVDVEATMNLVKCMQRNSIYKGIFITLGDFKPLTKRYCHKNVIECLNSGQVIAMCREAQKRKEILQIEG